MFKKILPAFAIVSFVGCASVNKTLDKVDAGLQKADEAVAKADKVVTHLDKTTSRIIETSNKVAVNAKKAADHVTEVATDQRLIVAEGDTLWDLSEAKLGNGYLWPLLCDRNSLQDCNKIRTGQVLRYPSADALAKVSSADKQAYLKRAYAAPDSAETSK